MSSLSTRLDRLAAALAAHDETDIRQWLATLTSDQQDYLHGALATAEPPDMTDQELFDLLIDILRYHGGLARLVRLAAKYENRTDSGTLINTKKSGSSL